MITSRIIMRRRRRKRRRKKRRRWRRGRRGRRRRKKEEEKKKYPFGYFRASWLSPEISSSALYPPSLSLPSSIIRSFSWECDFHFRKFTVGQKNMSPVQKNSRGGPVWKSLY